MADHAFISYSRADAADFARQLADALDAEGQIHAWLDTRDITPGFRWDDQTSHAIKTCKCMIFVMTKDSVASGSICQNEWTHALKYKKVILPLQLHKDAEQPFGLGSRQEIDFTGDFRQGVAQLRSFLRRMDSPAGVLQSYFDRLADAERALRRANGAEAERIEAEVEELKKQIELQQRIVDDPEAAGEQTRRRIIAELEHERERSTRRVAGTSPKFINPPPGIAPMYFQNRFVETKLVVDAINDDAQRLITIAGRGGVGKTTMVCRLLKSLETGELPDELGAMNVDGIVYLSDSSTHRVNFANIFYDLCKLLPPETASQLDAVYKDSRANTEEKMSALLDHFTDGPVVLLLDNFEPLVDTESAAILDSELEEALRAFLNGPHTAVNIIITTRIPPRALNLIQPGRQRLLTLDEGLESPHAENILREMDSDGRLGLKTASADVLRRARLQTRGYPRALEALFAILASDRYTTLEELLATPTPENVVEAMVGEAFNRLDLKAQRVMQALAVYRRPMSPSAIDYLLAPHMPTTDSAPILQRLANMHFTRREGDKYYLHPVDSSYAFHRIPLDEETGQKTAAAQAPPFARKAMSRRGADYFRDIKLPKDQLKTLDDLSPQLGEIELRCAAGDYDTAAKVLNEIGFDCLVLWGHWNQLIKMHHLLADLQDYGLQQDYLYNLSSAYRNAGDTQKAIDCTEQALSLARGANNRADEARCLWSHGISFVNVGQIEQATRHCENALQIIKELGDEESEAGILCSSANCYLYDGAIEKAIEYNERARAIAIRRNSTRFKAESLFNLGNCHSDRREHEEAVRCYLQAIDHADQTGLIFVQNKARYGLACEHLFQRLLTEAQAEAERAREFDYPRNNHDVSAILGVIHLHTQDPSTAARHFDDAVLNADSILALTPGFYRALYAKALALAGLAVCRGEPDSLELIAVAKSTYLKGRTICSATGVVARASKLLNTLSEASDTGILHEVRAALGDRPGPT